MGPNRRRIINELVNNASKVQLLLKWAFIEDFFGEDSEDWMPAAYNKKKAQETRIRVQLGPNEMLKTNFRRLSLPSIWILLSSCGSGHNWHSIESISILTLTRGFWRLLMALFHSDMTENWSEIMAELLGEEYPFNNIDELWGHT